MIDKTVCELFAGVGGFRLGLEKSSKDWKTVWANQWEPKKKQQHAFDCYCEHYGKEEVYINEDIASIEKSKIPDHNLLVGGFPCQDYSVARTGAKGINGVKGVLWWQIREIIEIKRPKFILLENVDRLLKSPTTQRGRDFGVMLACFKDLGYAVEWRVINAAEYGFTQRRRRTFIFAYDIDTSYALEKNTKNAQSIIYEEGFFANTFPVEYNNVINNTSLKYKVMADVSEKFKYAFDNSGYMINGEIYTCNTMPILVEPTTIRQIIEKEAIKADDKYYISENLDKWKYLKGAKSIDRISKEGHNYKFSEGPISFPDSIDKPARTMLTSESSLNRSTHVIEDPYTNKLRLLTPIEAECIQGFKPNWTNTGMPEKFRYFCMGNALVVGLVTKMGQTLNEIFGKEESPEIILDEERKAI